VVAGKALGTAHPRAKVFRDLSKLFHADCVAGQQLYDKLLDPSSLNTSKGSKSRSNMNISTSKQHTGTKDVYTNISAVIANETCDDALDDSASDDASTDGELTQFLAKMSDDARAQAVDDYPELARCIKQTVDRTNNTSQEDDLLQFFDLQTKDYKAQAIEDYPELKTILQPDESLHHPSSPDPVLAAIARKGIGPTDAYIMSINASSQTHNISSMPATNYQLRQPMVDTTPSVLSYLSTSTSDLRKAQLKKFQMIPFPNLRPKPRPHGSVLSFHGGL
jgi:hypothetical protein